jgi:hypothetical protein
MTSWTSTGCIFPVVPSTGKRLFADGALPLGPKLLDSKTSGSRLLLGRVVAGFGNAVHRIPDRQV